jgi:hypothetical protein
MALALQISLLPCLTGTAVSQQAFGIINSADSASVTFYENLYEFIVSSDSTKDESFDIRAIPNNLFRNVFNDALPDLVVLVDDHNRFMTPVLLLDGHPKQDLYGKKHVWVVVVQACRDTTVTCKNAKPKNASKPDSLKTEWVEHIDSDKVKADRTRQVPVTPKKKSVVAKLSPLNYTLSREGAILGNVLSVVAASVGVKVDSEAKPDPEKDIDKTIEMVTVWNDTTRIKHVHASPTPADEPDGGDSDSAKTDCSTKEVQSLRCGIAKFPIAENTINRIRVTMPEQNFLQSAYATFGNYSPSRLGISIGVATQYYNGRESAILVFGHFYLRRPQLPNQQLPSTNKFIRWARGRSCSLVIGSTIDDGFGSKVYAGFAVGHLLQRLGIAVLVRNDYGGPERAFWSINYHL